LAERQHGTGDDAVRSEVIASPNNPDAWLRLGQTYNVRHAFTKAIQAFRRALELKPGYPEAMSALAVALTNTGNAKEAIPLARQATSLAPNDPRMHAALAFALAEQGEAAEALQEADQALGLDPTATFVLLVRSEVLRALGRMTEAYEAAKSAAEVDPDNPAILRLTARAALGANQYAAAETFARHTLEIDPTADQGHLLLGLALSQQRAFPAAERAFRAGLDLKPNEPDLLNGLAYVLVLQNRFQEAEPLARKAANLLQSWYVIGTLAVVAIGLGDTYKDQDLYSEARDLATRALQLVQMDIDPDEEAKLYLQRAYARARLGEVAGARQDFRIATQKARPLSNVGLAAGRNLRRLNSSRSQAQPPPDWLAHVVAVAAVALLIFASALIVSGLLDAAAYATIAIGSFAFVFVGYSLPSITRLRVGVVELERTAGPLPIPHMELIP